MKKIIKIIIFALIVLAISHYFKMNSDFEKQKTALIEKLKTSEEKNIKLKKEIEYLKSGLKKEKEKNEWSVFMPKLKKRDKDKYKFYRE